MLSKRKLLAFRQCAKRLWLETHRPELMQVEDTTHSSLARGRAVGGVARHIFGPGELLQPGETLDLAAQLDATQSRLAASDTATLFEATFAADGVLVMADVLRVTPAGAQAIEVKGSSEVKDYYIEDCAIQAHVMRQAGVNLTSMSVAHINTSFRYEGDENYRGLLKEVDVSANVAAMAEAVISWIQDAKATLNGAEPDVAPGDHCSEPYACPFFDHCNKPSTEYPLSVLPRLSKKRAKAFASRGYVDIRQLPREELATPSHLKIWDATSSGKPFFDEQAIQPLRALGYPRFYLDFETINFAVPIWAGMRPFQQVPFQWSIHIERQEGALEHEEFLNLSGDNPARDCIEQLLTIVATVGPVIVYSGFERTILRSMANVLPDLAANIERLCERLVDLLPVVQDAYYHPAMMGSWSIKALLPIVAEDLNYDELEEVRNGVGAQTAYIEAITAATAPERRQQLRQRMLSYCGLDSLAMIRVMHFLVAGRQS